MRMTWIFPVTSKIGTATTICYGKTETAIYQELAHQIGKSIEEARRIEPVYKG